MLGSFSFEDYPEMLGDTYVAARGTWTSDTPLGTPVQTSRIGCWRNNMQCIESIAQIMNGMLIVNTEYYDIANWSKNEITTNPIQSGFGCTQYAMRLDRVQKQVTQTRITIKNTGECAGIDSEPIHLYLGDGWKIQQKSNK